MKIFFVDYDLRNDRNYELLTEKLEELGGVRVLKSLWSLRLSAENTCADVKDYLMQFIDPDDGIIVSQISRYEFSNVDKAPHKYQ